MRISGMAASAAVVMVAASVAAPAGAGEPVPNREKWADRYLSAVCPANAMSDRLQRQWDLAFGGRDRVPIGTPTTAGLRKAYRVTSRKQQSAGMKLNRWDWPVQVEQAAAVMTRYYYQAARLSAARADSMKVTRGWARQARDHGAATRMRIKLGLPPRGVDRDGC